MGVELEGIAEARPTPEVLEALASAEAVIIGPSNPVISIGPILSVPGMREALAAAPGPVVAVSPLVGGRAVKGPTDAFVRSLDRPVSAAGWPRSTSDCWTAWSSTRAMRIPPRRAWKC